MGRRLPRLACLPLLVGPTVLAFFSGGYFDEARAWAGAAAWGLLAVAVVLEPRGLPRRREAWLAWGALALFAAWTLLSILWAPVAAAAYHAGQIAMLYVGTLLAAALLLRTSACRRAVEPMLAAGALAVIGYGVSERLLPGVVHLARSLSAQGRLEQPLTYWNATGELAALGFVLSARVAGDESRSGTLRALAAAAAAPLGLGLYLSFSRGALFACAAGLVALMVAAPHRSQLKALGVAVSAGVLASAAAAPLRGVTSLGGSMSARERDGAVMLGALALVTVAAALGQLVLVRRERAARGETRPFRLPRRAPLVALAVITAGLGVAIVVGAKETSSRPLSAGASRYATLESNRYAYWKVAFRAFRDQPLRGVGAGGWAVYWLRYRHITEFAQDAHSLPVQTLAELGLVGVGLLGASAAGLAWTASSAHRAFPALAAGPIAGLVVYAAHAPLDWDWQMPAVTLVAVVLGGSMMALLEPPAARA